MKIFSTTIPGLDPDKTNTEFPVLLTFKGQASGQTGDLRFSRWMVSASPMVMMMIAPVRGDGGNDGDHRVRACSCVLVRARACSCVLLRAPACSCVLVRARACVDWV